MMEGRVWSWGSVRLKGRKSQVFDDGQIGWDVDDGCADVDCFEEVGTGCDECVEFVRWKRSAEAEA